MKLGKDNSFYKVMLVIQIISAVLIGYYLFIKEDIKLFLMVILENVIISAIIILYAKRKSEGEFNKSEEKLKKAIYQINGVEGDKFIYGQNDMFEGIYKALETVTAEMKNREKMREEVLRLVNTAASNVELSKMLEDLIPKLASSTESEWGAFYQANDMTNKLELKFSLGFSKNIYNEFDISIGEGFIGKAALTKKVVIVKDIPNDTVFATKTVLGKLWPRNLMFVPILNQELLLGVVILGSIHEYKNYDNELMEFINYYLGLAIGNGITYERTRRLTSELQFQNKLIQSLNEELEYKVAERTTYLNGVLDAIQDNSIYAIDKNGIITAWNKKAELILGFRAEDVIGEDSSVIFENDDLTGEKLEQRLLMVKDRGRYEEKSWRLRKDGTKCLLEMILSPMYDERGEFIGITSISKEVKE